MVGVMMGNEDMGYLDVVLSDAFEQGLEDAIGVDEYAVAVRAVCEEVSVREPPGPADPWCFLETLSRPRARRQS